MKYILQLLILISVSSGFISCKKYLDLKPDKKLTVPSSLKDLQALLDNNYIMNQNSPSYDEASSDNYFIPIDNYQTMSVNERKAYVWENYEYNYPNDWTGIYKVVNVANEVLHSLRKIERNVLNNVEHDNVEGSALVFRSESFLRAVWIFSKIFDEQTADVDMGIVLRSEPGFDQVSVRATVRQTYNKIITDLMTAVPLLSDNPVHVMRPSKQSAYGTLARTYLSMRKYDSAFKYSNLCLQLNDRLMDYNSENIDDILFPFRRFNEEVILNQSIGIMYYRITPVEVLVDSILYNSYNENDLRKRAFYLDASLFFPGIQGYLFKGTYIGDFGTIFTGITTAEMFLTRAESYVRLGDSTRAISDLNYFLKKRFKVGTFAQIQVAGMDELLQIILSERRKELVFRGLRWMDIKRLNKEGANIILRRYVDGITYTLYPNVDKYALPLPDDIVRMGGISQNPK